MAGMEELLLNDDSSSGDSDAEELSNVPASTSAVAATIQPTLSPTPPQQPPPQQQQQPPQNQPPPKSQSELSQRLKSLYSPASHAKKQVPLPQQQQQQPQPSQQQAPPQTRAPSHSTSSTMGRPPLSHHSSSGGLPSPQQQQQQQHIQQPAPQQIQRQSSSHSRGSSQQVPPQSLPRGGGGIKHQISSQQQQQQQQQGYSSPPQQSHHQAQSQQPPSYSHHQQSQHHPSSSSQPQPHHPGYQQQPQYRSSGSSSSGQHRSSNSGSSGSNRGPPPPIQQRTSSTTGSSSGGVPNPVPHGAIPPPGQRRSAVSTSASGLVDPFEPTPLHKIKEPVRGGGYSSGSSVTTAPTSNLSNTGGALSTSATAAAVALSQSEREKEMRRQKERFLMFTRVLMKYLESKDPPLHQKVKAIIKDCAERNKRQERGYESVTASMRMKLKEVVGEAYWKRAESYLLHFLAQKQKQKPSSSAVGGIAPPAGSSSATDPQKRKEIERQRYIQQQKLHQQQKLQQQQSAQSQQPQPTVPQQQPQQHPTPAAQQAATQPAQPAQSASTQAAPAPAPSPTPAKASRASGTGGKGKRAGGKQASGKAPKKARTKSTGPGGRGAKTAAAAAAAAAATTTQVSPQPQVAQAGGGATGQAAQQQATTPVGAAATAVIVQQPRAPSPPPVREYSDLMEQVDHAVNFDWTTAGLIMGSSIQKLQLQEEQRNLLYGIGAAATGSGASAKQASAASAAASPPAMEWRRESSRSGIAQPDSSPVDAAAAPTKQEESEIPVALRGWGNRNLVSPRVAWARVRRSEQPSASEQRMRLKALYSTEEPPAPIPDSAWVNEEKAEEDPTLCLLSEATQIYITQILQKALVCARQRQNLDGIRLWHQQCTAAVEAAKAEKEGSADKPTPPPLSIRLGCDINRQVARTMGNAALTCKRMEEALERQRTDEVTRVVPSKVASTLNTATIASAQSMGELSLLPPLSKASEKADYEARRSFEIYGGKFSHDPPFGRVPKKATLEAIDFQQSLQLDSFLGGGRGNRRHRTNPNAFSFF